MPKDTANSRIAKNTGLLYLRMLFVMGVSLYTNRVLLATLGVTDYGLYNVVGSIVTMFVFIRSAMGNATHRYIAFAIGKGDAVRLKRVYATCVIVHIILALLIVLLCETIGLWLFYNKMVIPEERMMAAFWVFQCSILTCALGVICVPFDAEIIAHEKMGAFAFISIFEVILKLLYVFLITIIPLDRLILFGAFVLLGQLIIRSIYSIYCHKHFEESRFKFVWDADLIKEMFGFAGWNIVGNMASIGCTPMINILLNMFFGPAVNAARGVAVQVQSAVKGFISNFRLAFTPQITKTYAAGDLNRMHRLIISGSKLSYFLFFCLALPIILKADAILSIWLVEVPEHASSFLRLVLFVMMLEAWEQSLHTANLATGKIKVFQTAKGLTLLMMIPISYVALRLGAPSESVFVIQFIVTFISLIIQLIIIRPLIRLPLRVYFKEVFIRPLIVTIVAFPIPLLIHHYLGYHNFILLLLECTFDALMVLLASYLLGLDKAEKVIVDGKMSEIVQKLKLRVVKK